MNKQTELSKQDARDIIYQIKLIEQTGNVTHEFGCWLQKIKLKALLRLNDLT